MKILKQLAILTVILIPNLGNAQQTHIIGKKEVADPNIILPPSWAFGVLYGGYTDQAGTIQRIKEIQSHDYPIDAYWIDSWFWSFRDKGKGPHKYIDFIGDTISYPDRKAMWDFMEQNNIKGGFWVWDCIMKTGNEVAFEDFKTRNFFRNIYIEKNSWHNASTNMGMDQHSAEHPGTECGNINFDDPDAVQYFKQKMKHFFDEGADFIKLDRTSEINVCKTMFEMSQDFGKETKGRGFLFSHSFGTEDEAYKRYPTKWTDDTRSDWTIEETKIVFPSWTPHVALKENIAMFTDPAKKTSEIPFLTNDTGGFEQGAVKQPDEELFIRWLQFSMFNPIVELFSSPDNPTSNLPWLYSSRADSIFRYYAHLRMELFPYIYSFAHRNRLEGKHMIGKIPGNLYEFMFGDAFLVAPVYEPGVQQRKIFFPYGKWVDYRTKELLDGNKVHLVETTLDRIPLFVRQGAIIPMRPYASSVEKGNNKELTLHIYCGASGSFRLIEDDGISNDYLNGIFAITPIQLDHSEKKAQLIIHEMEGTFEGMLENRNWKLVFHTDKKPGKMLVNNKKVKYEYNNIIKSSSLELKGSATDKMIKIDVVY